MSPCWQEHMKLPRSRLENNRKLTASSRIVRPAKLHRQRRQELPQQYGPDYRTDLNLNIRESGWDTLQARFDFRRKASVIRRQRMVTVCDSPLRRGDAAYGKHR